jgi:ribosomal protein L11 methyltransferase
VAEARWLEVSLLVSGELAEAVAEVLDRYSSNGVVCEQGVTYNDAEDEGTPIGPIKVYAYFPIDTYLEEKRQRLEEALWHLGTIQALPEPTYKTIEDEDWMSAWKKHYRPIPIGKMPPAWR